MTAHRANISFKVLLWTVPRLVVIDHRAALREFTIFSHLPSELRKKIWELACFEQRVVKLPVLDLEVDPDPDERVPGQSPVPAVLQVCRESREEGLRFYTHCHTYYYHPLSAHPDEQTKHDTYIYPNSAVDIVIHGDVDLESSMTWNNSPSEIRPRLCSSQKGSVSVSRLGFCKHT